MTFQIINSIYLLFQYIIIGDMGVGKSCLLHQFTEKKCMYSNIGELFVTWLVLIKMEKKKYKIILSTTDFHIEIYAKEM